ncbi:MAG: phospho-sugar mutase [Balneolales bacterium]
MDNFPSTITDRINSWLNGNYDAETKTAIQKLLLTGNTDELIDAFYKDLEFGTGGLRGIMGPGTNRVNKYTLGTATQGLSNYLKKIYPNEQIKVVIAHDNRNNAEHFAQITADVFTANDIFVYFFDGLRPTPELSFAIRQLNCHSGIMLTASHNPKEYSGYKAYWRNGGQVIAPHDTNIIDEVNKIDDTDQINFKGKDDNFNKIGREIDKLFLDKIKEASVNLEAVREQHDLSIVFSPIHGAAVKLVPEALANIGFTNISLVEEQCTIDGNFPTVVYPNPEEEEALSMALKKARDIGAELVMATDPDGDRVGIAVRDNEGEMTLLNGNQTGCLLIRYLLDAWEQKGRITGKEYIVKTIVTSYLMDNIAASKGIACYNVLTGFKYIGNLMTELEGQQTFIAGGEESYGYLVGEHARDKDAIVACAVIAEMAAYYKTQGKTLYDALFDMYIQYGFYKEKLISMTKKGKKGSEQIQEMMKSFRETPPASLGGEKVLTFIDYQAGTQKNIKSGGIENIDFPSSNVLQFITEGGSIISARPSGTEPKIKFYISVNTKLPDIDAYNIKNQKLEDLIKAISEDLKVDVPG